MASRENDARIRQTAFEWLKEQGRLYSGTLPRQVLAQGFVFEGHRVPLVGPQGIFKPKILSIPLSITTAPRGPYDDSFSADGLLLYRYRGSDPNHPENIGLRTAMVARIPLVYFHGVVQGKYVAAWPVFIVGDDPARLTFRVEVDDVQYATYPGGALPALDPVAEVRRGYVTANVRQRIHQQAFRERVLRAYQEQCALCRLRHEQLLDAAHIIPDREPDGRPIIPNGLALCKLHHAAFDRYFLAITPDYMVEIRNDILEEEDGPMLLHGLKGMHEKKIILPRNQADRPDAELLAKRYECFLRHPRGIA